MRRERRKLTRAEWQRITSRRPVVRLIRRQKAKKFGGNLTHDNEAIKASEKEASWQD